MDTQRETRHRPNSASWSPPARGDLTGLCDRALLLLGFAGALRRSEPVGIDREHLRFTEAGLRLLLPSSKTDQEGKGVELGLSRGKRRETCPVRALEASGDPGEVAAFRHAAAGAGAIPWQHNLGPAAEDWFHLLAVPPAPQQRRLSLKGARILAGQLREAAEARLREVAERAAASRACPLDLHRLLPVPARLLRLGPDHAEVRAWPWENWGTTQALRGVVELPVPARGQPRRHDPRLWWVGF